VQALGKGSGGGGELISKDLVIAQARYELDNGNWKAAADLYVKA
jgi:hypothetical protein